MSASFEWRLTRRIHRYLRESTLLAHRRDGAPPDDFMLSSELSRKELSTDKHLLMVIQTACKAERLEAALDATLLLTQPASIDAAAKIARFFNLPGLEERIRLVEESKTGVRQGEEDNKRQSKWAHLADERTITTGMPNGGNLHKQSSRSNLFAGAGPVPSASFTPRPSSAFAPSARLSTGKAQSSMAADDSYGLMNGSDGVEYGNESMDVDVSPPPMSYDDDINAGGGVSSPKRGRSGSMSDGGEQPAQQQQEAPRKGKSPERDSRSLSAKC